MTPRGWQRDGLILCYVGDLDADHGLDRDNDVQARRPKARKPREHGSRRGYEQHRYNDERACQSCRDANAEYKRSGRAARLRQAEMEVA